MPSWRSWMIIDTGLEVAVDAFIEAVTAALLSATETLPDADPGSLRRSLNKASMLRMYISRAPNTEIVTMFAVRLWPANSIKLSLPIAAMPTTPPARMAR